MSSPTTRRYFSASFLFSACAVALASAMAPHVWAKGTKSAQPSSTKPQDRNSIAPYESFYGVYVGGSKVGFMQARLALGGAPTLSYHLEAQVRGMGRTTPVVVEERRTYDNTSALLTTLSFRQTADSGSMTVTCARRGQQLRCTTTAGGAEHHSVVTATETLDDALAQHALVTAQGAHVGDTRRAVHFDPQAQNMTDVQLRIDAIDEVLTAGVKSRMFTVITHYPALGVKESSTVDGSGKLVATHMGGFFEARLEPEEVAKKLDLAQDVLMQAVVKAPQSLEGPETLRTLSLTMRGFDDAPPPASSRQQVRKIPSPSGAPQSDAWQLTLVKDAPLPPLPYPHKKRGPKSADLHDPEVQEALKATAFIQSTAKDIQKASAQAVAGAKTVPQAIAQLVSFVQSHLRAEYVPAFSNALEALHSGRGDCTEYSVLFVALARAANIPARVAVGVAYWPPGKGFGWHAWAEIFADGRWVSVDPTWGQSISDVTHLKFAEGGPTEQARLVMLLGRLSIEAMQSS